MQGFISANILRQIYIAYTLKNHCIYDISYDYIFPIRSVPQSSQYTDY